MHLPLRRWFPFGLPLRSEASARARRARAPGETSPVPRIRRFAAELARDPLPAPGSGRPAPAAGTLLTAGLLTEALRYLWDRYAGTVPGAVTAAHDHAAGALGPMRTRLLDETFRELYPPEDPVGSGGGEETDRELVLLRLTLENPAMEPLRDLFHDAPLAARTPWQTFVDRLEEGLGAGGPLPGTDQGLMDLLRAPMRAHPDSLEAQLAWVRSRWGALLPPEMLQELVLAADILREETRPRFGGGPGPAEVPRFTTAAPGEEENFSPDASWMPDVVLMAKSTYVWLDQLSRAWGRDIRRLDQIPDEELDRLAAWGVTGLWLIGLWERSPASRTIKRWMGNPEAEASAYSLWDYEIAADLGGDEAWRNLAARAGDRGIRLAADMVPNHTGIDSRWMVEHPERFLQLDAPPYPSYYFTCQDLCGHPDATVQIEDGYWSRSDAAVVFRCENRRDGRVRYVYHGNDGTSMPWNDTAQLDFLRRDTREAVIERILHVARRFPIIRFDAAMTLARKHFQRLWYPAPGDAGAVPSRAERGLSREAFEAAAPVEFWREVVDRVAAEAPGTLLLAEAFWLMEGYFVRTLGMHRVYNSAFMNMLKMEENAKYRATLRNVLEFSPDVLQRFVNFMNNPDERTAVEQFGRGDKYFGCALLLVTLPGLPMLGHGQVEGFTEKYGMEYRRAFLHETPDPELRRRHEAEIFPLMRRRRVFSGAQHFALYDLVRDDGGVDENVFAYSNRAGEERALIVYNNAWASATGRLHTSCASNTGSAAAPCLQRRALREALGLPPHGVLSFRDHRTGLTWLRTCEGLDRDGLRVSLGAYQAHAFVDFRILEDPRGDWRRLEERLGGAGVADPDAALRRLLLEPVRGPWQGLLATGLLPEQMETRALSFLEAATLHLAGTHPRAALREDLRAWLIRPPVGAPGVAPGIVGAARTLVAVRDAARPGGRPSDLDGELLLAEGAGEAGDWALALADGAVAAAGQAPPWRVAVRALLETPRVRRLLGVHEHRGVEWLRREALELLAAGLGALAIPSLEAAADPRAGGPFPTLEELGEAAGYRLQDLLALLDDPAAAEAGTAPGPGPEESP